MESFLKRFRLFAIGLLIGGVASYFFLGDRLANMGWFPSERIKDRLESTLIGATPKAQLALDAKGITLAEIRANIKAGNASLFDADHSDDSLFYKVECRVDDKPIVFVALMHKDFYSDTTALVWEVE